MSQFFAVCAPGMEPWLRSEMFHLGMAVETTEDCGGVSFRGEWPDLYRMNFRSRLAVRVLARFMWFRADDLPTLRKRVSALPWGPYLGPGGRVKVRATCRKSRVNHGGHAEKAVLLGIRDRVGSPEKPDTDPDEAKTQLVVVRLVGDRCHVSVDSSGDMLYRRGYRLAAIKAPLRETLAAGMLAASGWRGDHPLVDPFCGSGTILAEAALLASGTPPGFMRSFRFQEWPVFDEGAWQAVSGERDEALGTPLILGSDRDAGAIRIASENLGRAGVGDRVRVEQATISELMSPGAVGHMVTNPPYGVRLGKQSPRNLYARLGSVLRERFPGWQVTLICPDRALVGQMKLPVREVAAVPHGGRRVGLYTGTVP